MEMSYQHDIFISYPSTLNKVPYEGWVTTFEKKLRLGLEDHLPKGCKPDIYLDERKVEANSTHGEMLDRARRSRIFLAIVSPIYQEREWAPQELAAFAKDLNDLGRLFVIASKPLPEDEIRLEALKGRPIKRFYEDTSDKRKALPFHPSSSEFERSVFHLSGAMADKLNDMLGKAEKAAVTTPSEKTQRTILLAQVTDDLEQSLKKVTSEIRQYCLGHGVELLSAEDYPLGGDAFKQAFKADLVRADLVVQLLGETLGKRPRDLPEGYVVAQARAAAETDGVKLMQWRRSNLELSEIDDPVLRDLMQNETVMASTLVDFCSTIIEWMKLPPEKTQLVAPSEAPCGTQVFINAERVDLPAALACKEAVSDLCASVWVPPQGDPSKASIQEEFNDLLAQSDSLLFINGNVETVWVAKQMRQAIKARASSAPAVRQAGIGLGAVCNGPPPGKPDLHGAVRGIEILECYTPDGNDWDFQPIREYVRKLTDTTP